jgi:hypothetical protein
MSIAKLILFILILVLSGPHASNAMRLPESQDQVLAFVLSRSVEIGSVGQPTSIRLYLATNQGECDDTDPLSTCPVSQVYAAIGTFGDPRSQSVFVTPQCYDWKIVKWVKGPLTYLDLQPKYDTSIVELSCISLTHRYDEAKLTTYRLSLMPRYAELQKESDMKYQLP